MDWVSCAGDINYHLNTFTIQFVSLGVFHQGASSKWGISRNIDRKMKVKILLYLIFLLGGGKGVCGRLMSPQKSFKNPHF
jgi:hypothetical protein